MTFVIGGGLLLLNVCWPHGASFQVICELYNLHIISKYGENPYLGLKSSCRMIYGINVRVAQEDADVLLIARTAIELKQITGREVAVLGNDTDLLVLLIGLSDSSPLYCYKITPGDNLDQRYLAHRQALFYGGLSADHLQELGYPIFF
ncbi:hypothetical protein M0804_013786 [Polistes exclamans]|nr:hypothetical protein M0804_013786 [Polistes exclamans]